MADLQDQRAALGLTEPGELPEGDVAEALGGGVATVKGSSVHSRR